MHHPGITAILFALALFFTIRAFGQAVTAHAQICAKIEGTHWILLPLTCSALSLTWTLFYVSAYLV